MEQDSPKLDPNQDEVLSRAAMTRQRAEAMLKALQETRREYEAMLRRLNRPDLLKAVTGQSAVEAAIAETRRMIAVLDRALDDLSPREPSPA